MTDFLRRVVADGDQATVFQGDGHSFMCLVYCLQKKDGHLIATVSIP